MNKACELLVGIVNTVSDFNLILNEHWYRVPQDTVEGFLRNRWPPQWIAFYQSGQIKNEPFLIKHYAKVSEIKIATRKELFPTEKTNTQSDKIYYKLIFNEIHTLPKPVLSRRWRRIVFIDTTLEKLKNAKEINDLYDGSALEDRLWAEMKRNKIEAERQELIQFADKFYFLDFAVYCMNGKIDIETDGDKWHHNPQDATKDNIRNNDLSTLGWNIIRFNSQQIHESISTYCIPKIKENVNNLGGIKIDENFSKRFIVNNNDSIQGNLFEDILS